MGQLYAITPFSLLDYPGELACIAWFSGCNLRCKYCHNPNIVLNKGNKEPREFLELLEHRVGLLTAAVFSGGEATFCPSLINLIRQAKALGYKTKLDTNGTRPDVLEELTRNNDVDYIALDYKCPESRTEELLGTAYYVGAFKQSLNYLIQYTHREFTLEVRTTFHSDLMTDNELNEIIETLDAANYRGTYYIQNISSHGDKTLGKISKPQRHMVHKNLRKPKNFNIAFRNFEETIHLNTPIQVKI